MRMSRYLILVFCLLLAAPLPARADFDAGVAAYERGDFEAAMTEWLPLAEAGDAEAQYRIGRLYDRGEGVEESSRNALHWYKISAENGHKSGTYNLGHMYWHGAGLKRDRAKAVSWFRRAAERGHPKAQHYLGKAYEDGQGVEEDQERAVYWFERAARQGNTNAHGSLSYHYMYGKGVKMDPVKSFMWFTLWQREPNWRTYIVYPILWSRTEPLQRQEAKNLAREWKPEPE